MVYIMWVILVLGVCLSCPTCNIRICKENGTKQRAICDWVTAWLLGQMLFSSYKVLCYGCKDGPVLGYGGDQAMNTLSKGHAVIMKTLEDKQEAQDINWRNLHERTWRNDQKSTRVLRHEAPELSGALEMSDEEYLSFLVRHEAQNFLKFFGPQFLSKELEWVFMLLGSHNYYLWMTALCALKLVSVEGSVLQTSSEHIRKGPAKW